MHNFGIKSAVSIETPKRALYHESLILNESGFGCFPFQKHFRTQLMLLFCLIPKKSLTATILHAFIMPFLKSCGFPLHLNLRLKWVESKMDGLVLKWVAHFQWAIGTLIDDIKT